MFLLSDYRARKDAFFRSSQSPLPREQRKAFAGMRYFDENPALRIETQLHRYADPARVTMLTNTGRIAEYLKVGYVQFEFEGQAQTLQLYQAEDADELFLPFMDATSGRETYRSGRYLDVPQRGDVVTLDFNLAYNPWCAYGDQWSCPLPPKENQLTVRIAAGEMSFSAD